MLNLHPLAGRPGMPGSDLLRMAFVTTVAAGLLVITASAGVADPGEGWGNGSVSSKDGDTLEVIAEATSRSGGSNQRSGGDGGGADGDPGQQQANWRCTNTGTSFTGVVTCEPVLAGSITGGQVPLPGQPAADPRVLAQQARELLDLPHPQIRLSPPRAAGAIVNLPTWLWLAPGSWRTATVQVTAGAVTVTARATPVETIWQMGDGSPPVRCRGAGTPYVQGRSDPAAASPDCGHTYRRSSAAQPGQRYQVTATTRWRVTWTVVGGTGGGTLPDLLLSSTVPVAVLEVQAVNRYR